MTLYYILSFMLMPIIMHTHACILKSIINMIVSIINIEILMHFLGFTINIYKYSSVRNLSINLH